VNDTPPIDSEAYAARLFAAEDRHWWCVGMRAVAGALLRAELRVGRPARRLRVLDAGCGSGASLRWLAEIHTVVAIGVDRSPHAIRFARSRGERRLARASVLSLPLRSGAFDLVVSMDVLQHLGASGDAHAAIAEARRVLRPGGLFLVRTNCAAPGRRDAPGATDFHWYTEAEARALVASAGFEVTRSTHANVVSDAAARLRAVAAEALARGRAGGEPGRAAGAAGPPGPGLPRERPRHPLAHAAMSRMMALEAALIARGVRFPIGGAVFVVARKPLA
jgi:SAM-dependent methyltransferase